MNKEVVLLHYEIVRISRDSVLITKTKVVVFLIPTFGTIIFLFILVWGWYTDPLVWF